MVSVINNKNLIAKVNLNAVKIPSYHGWSFEVSCQLIATYEFLPNAKVDIIANKLLICNNYVKSN